MVDWKSWFPKTKKHQNYQKQMQEVISDIKDLGETYLDVGCGTGRFIEELNKTKKNVDGLDLYYNNFNLLTDKWPDKKYDVVFMNLVMIVFNEKDAQHVIQNAANLAIKYFYIFDEFRPQLTCGQQVDEGKWNHDPNKHLKLPLVYQKISDVNPIWTRFLYKV